MEDAEEKTGYTCRVGIYKPDGELIRKFEADKRIYHVTEVIDPKTLEPGTYHVIIQLQDMIMVDQLTV